MRSPQKLPPVARDRPAEQRAERIARGERPAPAVLMGGTLVIGALVFNELLGWKEQP